MMRCEKSFEVWGRARAKLNKGKLGKLSTPNWSSTIYSVSNGIPRRGAIAEKCSVKGKDSGLKFSRNDLQIVEGEPNEAPKKVQRTARKMAPGSELSKGAFTGPKVKKTGATAAVARSTRGK